MESQSRISVRQERSQVGVMDTGGDFVSVCATASGVKMWAHSAQVFFFFFFDSLHSTAQVSSCVGSETFVPRL